MKLVLALLLGLSGFNFVQAASTKKQPSKTDTVQVYFENLKDGDIVTSPFEVKMGLKGLKLRDAGLDPDDKTTGHHHLLINNEFIPEGQPIPTDDTHLHYGKSQTTTKVTLPPGNYTLTLQLADGAHRSYGKKLSSTIKVTVKAKK